MDSKSTQKIGVNRGNSLKPATMGELGHVNYINVWVHEFLGHAYPSYMGVGHQMTAIQVDNMLFRSDPSNFFWRDARDHVHKNYKGYDIKNGLVHGIIFATPDIYDPIGNFNDQ